MVKRIGYDQTGFPMCNCVHTLQKTKPPEESDLQTVCLVNADLGVKSESRSPLLHGGESGLADIVSRKFLSEWVQNSTALRGLDWMPPHPGIAHGLHQAANFLACSL